ncbi:putative nad-dependent deacetylase sirtuin-2 [Phaeomoniella chlamydospora]|uniref:NAD-dependent protein deacetylase n=1 Tax=Phaeomoniella chlamydospora TaxID=158046 RepID=A0A0G2GDM4_PHACM|nr:putative nad-dependent deacetylase sirtuin-2 [Phaeomoniella chlamydospora]
MGNESSTLVEDHVPPQTLDSRTLDSLAKYIKSGGVRKVVVMVGAGISTSAGIPDFRSPKTGLYANLARLNLPFAEAVFDISYFRQNPLPFYTLAHELYPGRYRPTISHSFIRLLHEKGILLKLFTQNIDCLEREAGVPADKIIEAHGSFATQRCIDCHLEYPDEKMKEHITKKEVPRCPKCNGLVKPDIVFFGESLPESFHRNRSLPSEADLAIVMGTSLTVQPFASLPAFVGEPTPRLLINLEQVGGLGSRADDVLLLGDCDTGVSKLADALGWLEELEAIWRQTAPKEAEKTKTETESAPAISKDEEVQDEIEKLTKDIDDTLKVSQDHKTWVEESLRTKKDTPNEETVKSDDAETLERGESRGEVLNDPETGVGNPERGLAHVFPFLTSNLS